jgi:hypothetical protein
LEREFKGKKTGSKNKLEKKVMKTIIFLLPVLLTLNGLSQDIYLKVKKGTAMLDSESLTSAKGARKLNDKSKVIVGANSLVLIKQNKKLLQLKEPKTYKISQIKQLLAKQKELSSSSYASVLFSEQMQKPAPAIQSGSVTRDGDDVNWNELAFTPADGVVLFTDSLHIQLLNPGIVMGDTLLIRSLQAEYETRLLLTDGGKVNVANLAPGSYEWILSVSTTDPTVIAKSHLHACRIRIPSREQKTAMLQEEAEFKQIISAYDPDIQTELLQEFYRSRNWWR